MNHKAIYNISTGVVVGTVSASILAEPEEGFAYIDFDPATDPRGWLVVDGVLVPQETLPPNLPVTYSFNEWCDRFSKADQIALASASMSNPAVKLIYDRAMSAAFIDPTDPRTIASTYALVSLGVISQASADAALGVESA